MNVCMISGFADYSGGVENVVACLKTCLSHYGVNVSVFADVKPYFLPSLVNSLLYKRTNFWKLTHSLRSYFSGGYFDVIHGHGDNCFFQSVLKTKTPLITTFHGCYKFSAQIYDPRTFPSVLAEKAAVEYSDVLVAVSEGVKREMRELYGAKNVFVIHNGVDTNLFRAKSRKEARKRLGLKPNGVYALWVGHDPIRKGLFDAVVALKSFPDVTLVVVGFNGCFREKNILCLSTVSFSCLIDLYSACDFFFFPTLYEGHPLSVMEALSCGLPVLVSQKSNMGELIDDGVHGYVVGDGCYSDKIDCFFDSEHRRKMSVACRELALKFSWKNQATEYLELYRKVA